MNGYVLLFSETDGSALPLVGGKGANLGELSRIPGIEVPDGFCVTTKAYAEFVGTSGEFGPLLESLGSVRSADAESLAAFKEIGRRIRDVLERLVIPERIEQQILRAWRNVGAENAYAIRSSATAEDLPGASFAGQQDTYLNIKGEERILSHIKRCWASLFSDRAIAYRAKNGFDHRRVMLSAVVQQMVFPDASGIMFTADPMTGNRLTTSIDAAFGLGEALVSGLVNPDLYKVRAGRIIEKRIGVKRTGIFPLPFGGTESREIPREEQGRQALSDADILRLEGIGRRIEGHFGLPQDIEWGMAGGMIHIVQSRPITTLYPMPELTDTSPRVFASFGHSQMMTDPIKPLGISIWKRAMTAVEFGISDSVDAGGRLYFDITNQLASWLGRKTAPLMYGKADALMSGAISEVLGHRDFIASLKSRKAKSASSGHKLRGLMAGLAIGTVSGLLFGGVEAPDIGETAQEILEPLRRNLRQRTGSERLGFIAGHLESVFDKMMKEIGVPIVTAWMSFELIGRLSLRWTGRKAPMDELTKSAPNDISAEMGLELGDLADLVRLCPAVLEYMQKADDKGFFEGLRHIEGGEETVAAFNGFLAKYGARCPGEIDITRPRWLEKPTLLVPAIVSHIQSAEPGGHRLRFEEGKAAAERAKRAVLESLRGTRLEGFKTRNMTRLIETYRKLIGLREYPKYFLVRLLYEYKQAIMEDARELAERGVLIHADDVFYLTFEELGTALETGRVDQGKIAVLKGKYDEYEKLKPPRILTSEGDAIYGSYASRGLPEGVLPGMPVSSGIVEGRARIVSKPEEANLEKGDILVAPFTDPGWTPLFLSASGLVTEVGGLMTHGAVVAREYGIPAVVGVDDATRIIRDGQMIRVDGAEGTVEVIEH